MQKKTFKYKNDLDNLRELWSLLRSANRPPIHKLSDLIHTIVLPEELYLKWPFGDRVGNLLFVRPSQQATLDAIIERFKTEALIEGRKRFDHYGFIVKGEPDIGTSRMHGTMRLHVSIDLCASLIRRHHSLLCRQDYFSESCAVLRCAIEC